MEIWGREEIEKAILDIKKKSMQDGDFRKLCLSDAARAVKAVSGKELPDEVKLKFIENIEDQITIVLPEMHREEMSETDLDRVAAGRDATYTCPFTNGYTCAGFNCY